MSAVSYTGLSRTTRRRLFGPSCISRPTARWATDISAIRHIIGDQLAAICHRRNNMSTRRTNKPTVGDVPDMPGTPDLLELTEVHAPAEEGHHPRLIGWKTSPVSGYDIAAMTEIQVADKVIWPPMLYETLIGLGARHVYRLSRPGTMVRFFVDGSR
jgi:hypothetical protein